MYYVNIRNVDEIPYRQKFQHNKHDFIFIIWIEWSLTDRFFFSSPDTVDKLNSVFELSIAPQLTILESAQYIQRWIMSDMGISSTVVLNLYVFNVLYMYEEF